MRRTVVGSVGKPSKFERIYMDFAFQMLPPSGWLMVGHAATRYMNLQG